jgi:hypothetical protein
MKYIKYFKLFEEFSESGFKHDFDFCFGEEDDFYVEVNLKERIARVEIPADESHDHGAGGAWYDPKTEIRLLVQGQNDPMIEHINSQFEDCFHNHTIPVEILLDSNEDAVEVNDNTFIMPLKVEKETYNDFIIRTKQAGWGKRIATRKYGL